MEPRERERDAETEKGSKFRQEEEETVKSNNARIKEDGFQAIEGCNGATRRWHWLGGEKRESSV